MENFEINSNENTKQEVNNNRSSNNNNNTETRTKILTDETRNGGGLEMEVVNVRKCNGDYCEVGSNPETSSDDDDAGHHNDDNNDGELVEEIILLPNNFISDDELSTNSDDCIYAYRGGHLNNVGDGNLVLEPVNLVDDGQDEETDFLEMDFDPEPNSEIENFMEDERHFNHLEANFFTLRGDEGLRELPSVSQLRQNGTGSPLDTFQDEASAVFPSDQNHVASASHHKTSDNVYTGAKPKLVTSNSAHKLSTAASYSKDPYESDSNRPESTFKPSSAPINTSNHDDSCLECAEAEFIHQTKPETAANRKCPRHRSKVPSVSYSPLSPSESCLTSSQAPIEPPPPTTTTTTTKSLSSYKEFMVTIYSINCDYETIVEAANIIGVSVNTEILQHYFDNLLDEETATMSICEYLLYVSKRNCNYKRLIEVIKAACQDPIDIHFYPHDPCNSRTPEIVQISTSEITQRWNRNTDLRQILKFKNKHFKSLNVLGKVVSAIRQFESSDRLKVSNTHINIPQYYRSGYICITKLVNSASTVCS